MKLKALFNRLVTHGKIRNEQQFKYIDKEIWEFKCNQVRMPCFKDGNDWVLTHGFIKKQNKWPKGMFQKTLKIKEEHIRIMRKVNNES